MRPSARRRVLDLIKRGKTQEPVEFGHKVFLAESARGLITQYRVPVARLHWTAWLSGRSE